ncbi:MAG: hypothetical protein JWP52_2916 [Rhizobacter sp.]|nr:hypothetical protein [Rhizobacter sp.]
MTSSRRVLVSLVSLVLALAVALAWLKPLDDRATAYVDAGLQRALISFAVARALNAVVSVARGTEVAVQPAGVGLSFAPGQALEPIHELIEQFSSLMLMASVAFGMQKVLIAIGAFWVVSLALTAAAVAWIALSVRPAPPPPWLSRLLVALVVLRFAVPVAVVGSDLCYRLFLAAPYEAGQASISRSTDQFTLLASPPAPAGNAAAGKAPSVSERLRDWWTAASQNLDIGQRYAELKDIASHAVEHLISLIVVFLLQTLVLPLLILWLLRRAGRALAGPLRTRVTAESLSLRS